MKKDWNNRIDDIQGKMKETVGKITNNEELELKGKMQSISSDMKQKGEELKERAAKKVNDLIDTMRDDD